MIPFTENVQQEMKPRAMYTTMEMIIKLGASSGLGEGVERLYCLLVSDFLVLCQLFVIPCAFIIILGAVDKLLCINTIISQENFNVTCALNIILDAVDIISRMHTVI